MAREKLGKAHLFVPAEGFFGILRELDVVGRVGVDEVARIERQRLEITGREVPLFERRAVGGKVAHIIDPMVAAEGHVELALAVEAAKPVVASAIEIIEKA